MTMLQTMKKCPRCKRKYAWNPDLGQGLFCPYCASMGVPAGSAFEEIMRKMKRRR